MDLKKIFLCGLSIVAISSCRSAQQIPQQQCQQPYNSEYQQQQGYYQQGQQPYNGGYQQQQGYYPSGEYNLQKSAIRQMANALGTGEIRALGEAESGKRHLAYRAAVNNAVAQLRLKIETYVKYGMKAYTQEIGVNSQYALDESTRESITTAAKGKVEGAIVLDQEEYYNPSTKRYRCEVCVKLDRAEILSAMAAQSARIRQNELQFEQDMQQAWDELDASNNAESLDEQKAQRKNEMEQQNLDRQHQREMESQYQSEQMKEQERQNRNNRYQQNLDNKHKRNMEATKQIQEYELEKEIIKQSK